MLGKLIKNEFKSSGKVLLYIYLAAGVAALTMMVGYLIKIDWVAIVSTVFLVLIGVAIVIITQVLIIVRFYKSLYGSEGYLSHTLPVKSSSLFSSKVIVSFIWSLVSALIMLAIVGMILLSVAYRSNVDISAEISKFLSEANLPNLHIIEEAAVIFGVMILFQMLYFLSQVFFSITLANVRPFNELGPVAGSIVIYIVLSIIMQIITTLATFLVPVSFTVDSSGFGFGFSNNYFDFIHSAVNNSAAGANFLQSQGIGIGGVIVEVAATAAFLVITTKLIEKKINIK